MDTGIEISTKISATEYFEDIGRAWLKLVCNRNATPDFDCIVAMKRSGLMMGAFLSNKLNIPMFVTSEIPSIPEKFKRCLLVDDKCWRGSQFRKNGNKLIRAGKSVITMTLYIEADFFPDVFVRNVGQKVNLFYER